MGRNSVIKKLRDGEHLELYRDGMFTRFQLNRRERRVCWERWISIDRSNWMNWNLFLSLREVLTIVDYEKGKVNQADSTIVG
jgi:hypothetical protein